MNIGSLIALVCFFMGFIGLVTTALLYVHEKFCSQCIVHWENQDNVRSYSIIKACTKSGASRIAKKNPVVKRVVKVVKQCRGK